MRSAGNFNPEWGYLAPAPSFMRTLRVVLVATAIGATAGAAVVISLIDRPTGERDRTASMAPHAIVTSAQAAPATAAPAATAATAAALPIAPQIAASAAAQPAPQAAASAAATENAASPSTSVAPSRPSFNAAVPENSVPRDATVVVGPKHSTGMAALSDASPSSEAVHPAEAAADQALIPPEPIPDEKKAKHHLASASASNGKNKPAPSLGAVLRRLFNPPGGRSYYPNR